MMATYGGEDTMDVTDHPTEPVTKGEAAEEPVVEEGTVTENNQTEEDNDEQSTSTDQQHTPTKQQQQQQQQPQFTYINPKTLTGIHADIYNTHLKPSRVIIHLDLDCFYAQVEHVRLGIPLTVPLCVQQWQGLIAVNYAARKAGIKRHCNVQEALKLCPELKLVHVATYCNNETLPDYHPDPHPSTHKVSLEPYRRASAKIFGILMRIVGAKNVQKASVDEAYLDVSSMVNQRILHGIMAIPRIHPNGLLVDWKGLGNVYGIEPDAKPTRSWHDLQLAIGAQISAEIRQAVYDELTYTCSTGISHNKTLSKLCSALHKPNQQTVMRESQVLKFMEDMDLEKIRNLGGKFGGGVEEVLGVKKAGEVWKFSKEELMEKFGNADGAWLYDIVRGVCHTEVVSRNTNKSMMAAKSFRPPLTTLDQVKHWLNILASELFVRLNDDYELHSRWPRTLILHFKPLTNQQEKSKSTPFPPKTLITKPDLIISKAVELFGSSSNSNDKNFPLSRMSLSVSGFEVEDKSTIGIRNFFGKTGDGGGRFLQGGGNVEEGVKKEDGKEKEKEKEQQAKGIVALFERLKETRQHDEEVVGMHGHEGIDEVVEEFPSLEEQHPVPEQQQVERIERIERQQAPPAPTTQIQIDPIFQHTTCPKCQSAIPWDEYDSHMDWHFAKALIESERISEREREEVLNAGVKRKSETGVGNYGNNGGNGNGSGSKKRDVKGKTKEKEKEKEVKKEGSGLLKWLAKK